VRTRRLRALTALLAVSLAPLAAAGSASAAEVGRSSVVTTKEVVGTSVEGRPIRAIHRSREGATRTLLVIGNMHGDERAGIRVVRRLRDRPHLPADLDLWLVPTINPDGTAADRRTNAHGVDLNRNFPHRWRRSARGATWSGPERLSEPESVALRRLVMRVQPRLTVIFHQPLFGVGANDKGMPTVRALARGMRLPVAELHCGSVCYGTFSSWLNHRLPGLAVTVEFGHRVPDWRIGKASATLLDVGSALR
jgi:protein MpaA